MIGCEQCLKAVTPSKEITKFKCDICGNLRFSTYNVTPRVCDVCAVGKSVCQVCQMPLSGTTGDNALDILNDRYKSNEFHSKIKGSASVEDRQKTIQALTSGQELYYLHEKDNQFDPNAIKLFADKEMKIELGYINKDITPDLLDFMYKHGIKFGVFVSQVTGGDDKKFFGCNIRIKLYR
jgi:hypothetical protein